MQSVWHQAAVYGDIGIAAGFIEEGYNVDSRDGYGQTAIMLAAVHGHRRLVDLLIQHNAHLDVTAKHGLSALMLAIINGHTDIAMALIEAGANPELRGYGAPGFAGKTAGDLAVERGLNEIAGAIRRMRP